MKSFLQYISEIFDPKTEPPPEQHSDYEGEQDGVHTYQAGVGRDGVVTSLFTMGTIEHRGMNFPGAVEAEFRVNNSWKKNATNRNVDPREVFRAVHSHFDHFIRTRRPSAIFYETADPVRDRIYRMAARRYGIAAFNYADINATKGRRTPQQPHESDQS